MSGQDPSDSWEILNRTDLDDLRRRLEAAEIDSYEELDQTVYPFTIMLYHGTLLELVDAWEHYKDHRCDAGEELLMDFLADIIEEGFPPLLAHFGPHHQGFERPPEEE